SVVPIAKPPMAIAKSAKPSRVPANRCSPVCAGSVSSRRSRAPEGSVWRRCGTNVTNSRFTRRYSPEHNDTYHARHIPSRQWSLHGTSPVDGPGLCAWVCEPDNGFAMASRPGETPSYEHRGDRDHGDRPDQNPGVAGEGKLS